MPTDHLMFSISILLAALAALALDAMSARRGLLPPGFSAEGRDGTALPAPWPAPWMRRALGFGAVALVLWLAVFLPLAFWGRPQVEDFSDVETSRLFFVHLLLVAGMAAWYVLGFRGLARGPDTDPGRRRGLSWPVQFGLRAPAVGREIGLGLAAGVAAWIAVLLGVLAVAALVAWTAGEDALPRTPPPMVRWLASLPVTVRLAVSLSAGLVEESFFRGFLQPRVGIALSTAFFVVGHASYDQPLMLVGVAILSLIFGLLVEWRQNIWPAIAAHALFDVVQLLVVIPIALDFVDAGTR